MSGLRGTEARIRRAAPGDEAALVDLLATLAVEVDPAATVPPDRAGLARGVATYLDAPDPSSRFFLVAEIGREVAGAVSVQRLASVLDGRPYFLVDDLVVSTAHRRAGLARRLLAEVESLARASACPRVELYVRAVNLPALTVVSRAGYRKAPDVHLTLTLTPPGD